MNKGIVKSFQVAAENFTMVADIMVIGSDLLVIVTGGDAPHIGTVTTVSKESDQETFCFHSHHGRFHKDGILGEKIIARIKEQLPNNCVVLSGVHVDHISKTQIKASSEMADRLGKEISVWLEKAAITKGEVIY